MKFLLSFFSLRWMRVFDFLAPLAIRILLFPILWIAGVKHLGLFSGANFVVLDPATWWNQEAFQASAATLNTSFLSGLGSEALMMFIGSVEVAGAILLILGLGVRWVTLALLCVIAFLGLMSLGNEPLVVEAQKLWLDHGYVATTHSQLEIYITYFVLLLALFFMGAGRWFSMDWFLYRRFLRDREEARSHAIRQPSGKRVVADPFEIDATDKPGVRRAV